MPHSCSCQMNRLPIVTLPLEDAPEALHKPVINAFSHPGHSTASSRQKPACRGTLGWCTGTLCRCETGDEHPGWRQGYAIYSLRNIILIYNLLKFQSILGKRFVLFCRFLLVRFRSPSSIKLCSELFSFRF